MLVSLPNYFWQLYGDIPLTFYSYTFDTLLLPATFTGLVYKDFASGTIWLWNLQMPGQHPSAPVHCNISQYCRYDKLYCNFIWVSLKKIAVLLCLYNALFPFYFDRVVVWKSMGLGQACFLDIFSKTQGEKNSNSSSKNSKLKIFLPKTQNSGKFFRSLKKIFIQI